MSQSINWLSWCSDTFAKAITEKKPILMHLTANWCGWCAVMEKTTYQDSQVMGIIEDHFIPMMVNVDQYPHVADRYHFGGYPSVLFLSGDGWILHGENYLSKDQMKKVLEEIMQKISLGKMIRCHKKNNYIDRKDKLKLRPNLKTKAISPSILEINEIINNHFDQKYGGFSIDTQDIKFPFPEIHDYLFLYTQFNVGCPEETMLRRTLDAMLSGELYDHELGGFFRFCDHGDWTFAHPEKLLENNAALAGNYLTAFHRFGKEQYRIIGQDTINYLISDFFEERAKVFAGSKIGAAVDLTPYTNWNSTAISSLLKAYKVLDKSIYLETALKVLESLWVKCYRLGRGMSHFYLNGPSEVELLSDQIKFITALYDAFLCTGEEKYLHRSQLLIKHLEKNYRLPEGNFSDIPVNEKRSGYLCLSLVPFVENADIAILFIKFACLIEARNYLEKAEEILRSLSGMIMGNPIFAAKYGQGLLEWENYRTKNQISN